MNIVQIAGHLSRPVGVLALTAALAIPSAWGITPQPLRAIALPQNTSSSLKNTEPFDTNDAPDQTIPGGTRNSLPHPFSGRGQPGQTSAGGTRGWCPFDLDRPVEERGSEPDLREQMILLADVNYPHTLASHPTFLIYVPSLLAVDTIQVSLFIRQDDWVGARVYKANLPVPPEGGLLRFQFPAEMPGLVVGQRYWFDVDLNCFVDGDKTSLVLLRAPLERVSLPEAAIPGMNAVVNSDAVNSGAVNSGAVNSGANLGASRAGSRGDGADGGLSPALGDWQERDRWLAEHQLWYDRLAWVAEQWQQRPQDPQLLQHWRTLLTAMELSPDLIPEPSVTCCASPELESFEAVESPEPNPAIAPNPTAP